MPTEMKLWRIEENTPKPVDPDTLDSEARLEVWIRDDIGMVSDGLLAIGQQVRTTYGGVIDLLALDSDANLVILELKKDMTPREVVAQALDYASWIQNLELSEIEEIVASKDLFDGKSLKEAFSDKFGEDLPAPESVNQAHRMYIVASSLDSATERIVGYLSETHGVDINAATFSYFKTPEGNELIGRSMLLNEDVVGKRAETGGEGKPRKRVPTSEEMRVRAEENGVGELWDKAHKGFSSIAPLSWRAQNSEFFQVKINGSTKAFVSMFPAISSKEEGLVISLRFETLSEAFNLPGERIQADCGLTEDEWIDEYNRGMRYRFDDDRLDKLIALLKENAPEG